MPPRGAKLPDRRLFDAAAPTYTAAAVLYRMASWYRSARYVHDGVRWAARSTGQLADDTGLTRRQVRRAVVALRGAGLVRTCQHRLVASGGVPYGQPILHFRLTARAMEKLGCADTCLSNADTEEYVYGQPGVTVDGQPGVNPPTYIDYKKTCIVDTPASPAQSDGRTKKEKNGGAEVRESRARSVVEVIADRDREAAARTSEESLERLIDDFAARPSSKRLNAVWRCAYVRAGHGFCRAWGRRDLENAVLLRRSVGDEAAASLVAEAVEHWDAFLAHLRVNGWRRVGGKPSMGLLASACDLAVDWLRARAEAAAGAAGCTEDADGPTGEAVGDWSNV